MKRAVMAVVTTAASIAIVSLVFVTSVPAAAQNGEGRGAAAAKKSEPAPRMPDGHPDLSGVWWPGHDIVPQTSSAVYAAPRTGGPPRPPTFQSLYQPWAAAKAKTLSDKDDPALWCIPSIIGPTPLVGNGLVGEIVQTPKAVIMLVETYHGFRIIPTDGRPHRDDVVPSYRGDAVGRWEGDALVVDVTNFSEKNWLNHHGDVSFHSDALHMVETYRRLDKDRLEITTTAEDPKVLTGKWTAPKTTLTLAPFEHVMETACENDAIPALMDAAAKQNYGRK